MFCIRLKKYLFITFIAYDSEEDLRNVQDTIPAIEVNNVTASWTSDHCSIKELSFQVPKGKLCAIIGSVGAGKVTSNNSI